MEVGKKYFEELIDKMKAEKGVTQDVELTAEDLKAMEEKSLKAIQERGKASVGDKTMVDALAPAVEAMQQHYTEGLEKMLEEAEAGALRRNQAFS